MKQYLDKLFLSSTLSAQYKSMYPYSCTVWDISQTITNNDVTSTHVESHALAQSYTKQLFSGYPTK